MQTSLQTLEFDKIVNKLEAYAYTDQAKETCRNLVPYLEESNVRARMRETTEARKILDEVGTPPLVSMKDVDQLLQMAKQGSMLIPEQLEYIGSILTAVQRLKSFLEQGKQAEVSLAYYCEELNPLEDVKLEIDQKIRGTKVDDYASNVLRGIRRNIAVIEAKIKEKADGILRANKKCCSEAFVVKRNGRLCLPVRKEYRSKMEGSVIDQSQSGATLFMEPSAIKKLSAELEMLRVEEENEERIILYTLTGLVADAEAIFDHNLAIIAKLDFIFAKGKLSEEMGAKAPQMNTGRYCNIKQGRHPLLDMETCVPLDFEIGNKINGIIITGPNTGGKTVSIKTVGLFCVMAQCGLHVPCESADLCMNSQVLCDIGDGQNITQNLSTFSAHMTNVLHILRRVNSESLVILDELGSGTDPAEGMGIAIAILSELKKSGCLFLATTHYPEVKTYAEKTEGILNARMAFDRETLRPLYRLEIGKAGKSCAFYIAKQLGMPSVMLKQASLEAYGEAKGSQMEELWEAGVVQLEKIHAPKIQRQKKTEQMHLAYEKFRRGDSVIITPENKIGIVCRKCNEKGEVLVQLQKEKLLVNYKRLKLHVAAEALYPEDYDFSIIFDKVAVRKARHQMERKYCEGLEIVE